MYFVKKNINFILIRKLIIDDFIDNVVDKAVDVNESVMKGLLSAPPVGE